MTTWNKSKKLAKNDLTARGLALAVRQLNTVGLSSAAAMAAFQDRCLEIGVTVPNAGYWPMLLAIVIPS